MLPEQRQNLLNIREGHGNLVKEFSYFAVTTRVALLQSQLTLFQTLGTIGLALLGIGLGVDAIKINTWSWASLIVLLILLIYALSLSRETIDAQDAGLNKAEDDLKKVHTALVGKVDEALTEDDPNIFMKYAIAELGNTKPTKREQSSAAEILTFLFISALSFGLLAFFSVSFSWLILGLCLLLTYLIAFMNWSLRLTKLLSLPLYLKQKP